MLLDNAPFDSSTIGIIGGADGPTAIFVADGFGWVNGFGLLMVILLLIPNLIYALRCRRRATTPLSKTGISRVLSTLEQMGRYDCMLLTVLDFGRLSLSFNSAAAFVLSLFGCPLLLVLYWIFWIAFFRRETKFRARMLAVLPAALFLFYGLMLRHPLLVGFALLFAVCHIRITWQNTADLP